MYRKSVLYVISPSHTLSMISYNRKLYIVFLRFICGFKEENITWTNAGRLYTIFVDDYQCRHVFMYYDFSLEIMVKNTPEVLLFCEFHTLAIKCLRFLHEVLNITNYLSKYIS